MKILILGIGNAQVDLIKYCKEYGFEVHACSYTEIGVGRKLADRFELIDIKDSNKIIEYSEKNNIDFIYSIGSNLAMSSVSRACDALGLPCFISYDTATICQNKALMRYSLEDEFSRNIDFKIINSPFDIDGYDVYPSVLKPVDSQGQRGVFLIENISDFKKYYLVSLSYSYCKQLIIEEYINAPEISVNTYFYDGDMIFCQTTDRISYTEYPGWTAKEHQIPSSIKYDYSLLYDLIYSIVKKLKIENGPVYFQIKLTWEGPVLIEVAPRLDGCHIWRLINVFTGINLIDWTIKHLVENKIPINSIVPNGKAYSLKFISEKPGEMVFKANFNVKDPLFLKWYYEDGDIVEPINGHYEKIGYFLS